VKAANEQSIHHRRLERFHVLNVGDEEKLIALDSADDEEIRYYICYDSVFLLLRLLVEYKILSTVISKPPK
jgi:hypothetical protein